MIHYGIDKGACVIACRRVNHHSLGLVYNKHIVILIDNIKRYVFGCNIKLHRLRNQNFHKVACFNLSFFFCAYLSVYADAALLYELLKRAS